jgi:hypothetical protein
MQDVIEGVPTRIPWQALHTKTGENMTGAKVSIQNLDDETWWDGGNWVSDIAYNDMTYTAHGAHYYPVTFPDAGEYQIIFSNDDPEMLCFNYIQTVYPAARVVLDDIDGVLRGRGATEGTVTILDADDNPVADADVWVTSDVQGLLVIAGTLQSDSQGEVTFYLDTGTTYYIWAQKDGINFFNPNTVVW